MVSQLTYFDLFWAEFQSHFTLLVLLRERFSKDATFFRLGIFIHVFNVQPISPCVFYRYRSRKGRIVLRYRNRWRYLWRLQFFVRHEWRPTRRYRGKVGVLVRGKYRPIRFRHGKPAYRLRWRWRRITYRYRKGRRRRHRRRRRLRQKMRRIRRYQRRNRRRKRRLRRYRRRSSPFLIYYRGKTRKIFRWKGKLTFRLGGRRRRIR